MNNFVHSVIYMIILGPLQVMIHCISIVRQPLQPLLLLMLLTLDAPRLA